MIVGVKLSIFLVLGVYRGLWKYVGLDNFLLYAKAVVVGSVVSVPVLLLITPSEWISRAVFVLDGLLLLALLMGSRLSFRLFRRLLSPPAAGTRRRVLIFGAGDAGVMLAWELFNNPALGCVPVGFADDDHFKQGSVIHGLTVFGGNGSLQSICRQFAVDEIVISSMKFTPERLEEIARECTTLSVPLRRMRIQIEDLKGIHDADRLEPRPGMSLAGVTLS